MVIRADLKLSILRLHLTHICMIKRDQRWSSGDHSESLQNRTEHAYALTVSSFSLNIQSDHRMINVDHV